MKKSFTDFINFFSVGLDRKRSVWPTGLFVCLLFYSTAAFAQPKITSFSPSSGAVGTAVTITGTGFNPSGPNRVRFGAVRVIANANAAGTSIVVNIPSGATSITPIEVVNAATNRVGSSQAITSMTPYFTVTTPIAAPTVSNYRRIDYAANFSFGIATGDFNNDGYSDFAASRNNAPGGLRIYINDQTGAFTELLPAVSSSAFYTLRTADMDGDGNLDLIGSPTAGSSNVQLFKGNGAGGFTPWPSLIGVAGAGAGIGIFDIDNDGILDVVTTYGFQNLAAFKGDGVGNFTHFPGSPYAISGTTNGYADIAAADFNHDTYVDMVIQQQSANQVSYFRNNGDGTFAFPIVIPTGDAWKVVAGQFDADIHTDFATVNFSSNDINIFKGNGAGAFTQFTGSPISFGTGQQMSGIVAGDFDGDGKADIGLTALNNFKLLKGAGTGGFASFPTFPYPMASAGGQAILANDLNGDNIPDLLISNPGNNVVSVFLYTPAPTITSFIPMAAVKGTTVSITGTNFYGVTAVTFGGVAASSFTVNSPTQIDAVVNTGASGVVSVTATAGTGSLSGFTYIPPPVITSFTPVYGTPGTTVTISGTTFGVGAVNNDVYFGSQRATIISATATTISVSVPLGVASVSPITVVNRSSGLQTSSIHSVSGVNARQFTVMYPSTTAPNYEISSVTVAPSNSQPVALAVADFNNDGTPDLVTANTSSAKAGILLGDGLGGFIAAPDFNGAFNPTSVVTGDFNHDGNQDIVIGDATFGLVRTGLGNGDGTFNSTTNFVTGLQTSMATGDFNSDGLLDLVTANSSGNVYVAFGNGGGSLSNGTAVSINNATSVTVGDFTGDGIADIAATTPTVVAIRIGVGDGTFLSASDVTAGTVPYAIVTGDFNYDYKLDLAIVNRDSHNVTIALGSGTALFSTSATIPLGATADPRSLVVGDFNGDGAVDVATTNITTDDVSVALGNGSGGFAAPSNYSLGTPGTIVPQGIVTADFNKDGYADLATANQTSGTLSILRFVIAVPTITSFIPTSSPVGTTVTITGTFFNATAANNIVYFGATKASVTGATTTSLTVTVPAGATFGSITVLNTSSNLVAFSPVPFTPTFTPSKGSITTADFSPKVDFTAAADPSFVAVGDLDGDGKPEVVASNTTAGTVSVFRNTSSAGSITGSSLAAKADFIVGSQPYTVRLADVDGDGKLDIITPSIGGAVTIRRNTSAAVGSITFAPTFTIPGLSGAIDVAVRDLDKDGKSDIAVLDYFGGYLYLVPNLSTVGSLVFDTPSSYSVGTEPRSIAIGDLDGDNKPDIAVSNRGDATVSLLQNTSSYGYILFANSVTFATNTSPQSVAIGDIDGDGKSDLVVANQDDDSFSILKNTTTVVGTFNFSANVDYTTDAYPAGIALTDLDGDGKLDIATGDYGSDDISIFRSTSTSGSINILARVPFTTNTGVSNLALADIDGDGRPDLIAAAQLGSVISILRNNPVFPPTISSFTPTSAAYGTTVTITEQTSQARRR